LRSIAWLGRWSRTDVAGFLLATALLAGDATWGQRSASGAYFFAAAVVLMLLAYAWLRVDASAARLGVDALRAAHSSATRSPAFGVLLALAAVSFVLGVTLPVVRLANPYAGTESHSLASLLWALHARGPMLPWLALLGLALVLPGLRLLYLVSVAL